MTKHNAGTSHKNVRGYQDYQTDRENTGIHKLFNPTPYQTLRLASRRDPRVPRGIKKERKKKKRDELYRMESAALRIALNQRAVHCHCKGQSSVSRRRKKVNH